MKFLSEDRQKLHVYSFKPYKNMLGINRDGYQPNDLIMFLFFFALNMKRVYPVG